MFYFLGIDLAGSKNTWAVSLEKGEKGLALTPVLSLKNSSSPSIITDLFEILSFCMKNKVLSVAIDAPLSFSLSNSTGFRLSDRKLKELLPKKAKNWVVSYHALMGVPIRALLLAQEISPYCGAILETHPRACFYLALPEDKKYLAFEYKKRNLNEEEEKFLLKFFLEKFKLKISFPFSFKEGIIDAIFCALVANFYFSSPERLLFLPSEEGLKGFGPFVLLF